MESISQIENSDRTNEICWSPIEHRWVGWLALQSPFIGSYIHFQLTFLISVKFKIRHFGRYIHFQLTFLIFVKFKIVKHQREEYHTSKENQRMWLPVPQRPQKQSKCFHLLVKMVNNAVFISGTAQAYWSSFICGDWIKIRLFSKGAKLSCIKPSK